MAGRRPILSCLAAAASLAAAAILVIALMVHESSQQLNNNNDENNYKKLQESIYMEPNDEPSAPSPGEPLPVAGSTGPDGQQLAPQAASVESILPPKSQRPDVRVNIREWTLKVSEDIRLVSNRTSCTHKIEKFFERESEFEQLDAIKLRDNIVAQINALLSQHRAAVNAIVSEAERLSLAHKFVKDLRINYTDVHRLRNELEQVAGGGPANSQAGAEAGTLDPTSGATGGQYYGSGGQMGAGQTPQFTSIGGGTPVPGPPEWQTPIRSIVMQVDKNFGDLAVNTSMSAVHLPLPIYAGSPEIMNGIAWTERLDSVFRRNLNQYAHVHHQYYGDHLGFLRTFPAHRWRIPRLEPDLFDARTRPWYVSGAATPKDVVILIDSSGSMTGLRREIAKGVVFEILDTLTPSDYFTVLRFSESVTPVGLPKCNLRIPRLVPQLEERCNQLATSMANSVGQAPSASNQALDKRDWSECVNYRAQRESRGQYLRDNPDVVLGKNGSYLADDAYKKSIFNVSQDIRDAYLLPATGRNIRYLKSNFTMPTAGIANFTHALMAAFELLQAYNRTNDLGSKCNQVIMLITDGAIQSHEDLFNRYNYPNAPVRLFTYMIGREVGDIKPTKRMACRNRGFYAHVINLSEVREQVQKYLPVMARPLVLSHQRPIGWTNAYGDETYQVLTDWVLEIKRRERARIMLSEERERLNEANSSDVINIELTNIAEYDELPLVDEELKNRIICEDATDDPVAMEQSLQDEIDPLGYNELGCHWTSRRADLLTSVVKPVFDQKNTSIFFERVLSKNVWTERETQLRNAQLLGVAAVDLRVADIIRAAPSHLLGPNGYVILLGQNGFVMHHPDYRALLEDPFDKQSRILKPYYNAVDLTHIEQVHHNESSAGPAGAGGPTSAILGSLASSQLPASPLEQRRKNDDMRLFKLREAAVRGATGFESIHVKRATDCRRRPHIRKQTFYYGPVKDTPFSFMVALPSSYGLNRLSAKLPLDAQTRTHFSSSAFDLWNIHPEYRYCELHGPGGQNKPPPAANQQAQQQQQDSGQTQTESQTTLMKLIDMAADPSGAHGSVLNGIEYADLSAISQLQGSPSRNQPGRPAGVSGERFICDKDLFPSLLFDARATYEPLGPGGSADYGDPSCNRGSNEMRSKLAEIYGLEMSFLATRSGLTRARVFDLSPRIKKLAKLFIERHNRAVDEAWYARTVDWNMRFQEEATIISVPYNAYIRLIAKLRQRITQRHPAANDTRANCDPLLDVGNEIEQAQGVSASSGEQVTADQGSGESSSTPATATTATVTIDQQHAQQMLNDQPSEGPLLADEPSTPAEGASGANGPGDPLELARINYNDYSSFDFLDLLANSSVHIAATQSVIANRRSKQRTPVGVTGHLYDYATFARRFLNSTSLRIRVLDPPAQEEFGSDLQQQQQQQQPVQKVDICPGGACPSQCGLRNDTIDCLLVDNNGFIIVGEELPHIGRSLVDYDERLMASLVERKVFHQIDLVDYQAICTRNDQAPSDASNQLRPGSVGAANLAASLLAASQAGASSASSGSRTPAAPSAPASWELARSLLANLVSALVWTMSTLYSALLLKSAHLSPDDLLASESLLGQWHHWHRSVIGVAGQSAVANQSLLALLPNKTYLRPCERVTTLYETRPSQVDSRRLFSDTPEYFVTKCGCSGWYVYDSVPQTNLLMLIVNTTSACRRGCEASTPGLATSGSLSLNGSLSLAPMIKSQILGSVGAALDAASAAAGSTSPALSAQSILGLSSVSNGAAGGPNKTAEDQVCAMLERDAQLYIQRPSSCLTSHPEEASIHICGGANRVSLEPAVAMVSVLLALLANRHLFRSELSTYT